MTEESSKKESKDEKKLSSEEKKLSSEELKKCRQLIEQFGKNFNPFELQDVSPILPNGERSTLHLIHEEYCHEYEQSMTHAWKKINSLNAGDEFLAWFIKKKDFLEKECNDVTYQIWYNQANEKVELEIMRKKESLGEIKDPAEAIKKLLEKTTISKSAEIAKNVTNEIKVITIQEYKQRLIRELLDIVINHEDIQEIDGDGIIGKIKCEFVRILHDLWVRTWNKVLQLGGEVEFMEFYRANPEYENELNNVEAKETSESKETKC